jgi:predicted RNA-binding protein associated with RNAse of E/G family
VNDLAEVLDLCPMTDEQTRQAIDQAIGILALLRNLSTIEPAARLHLITSLDRELETRRATAIIAAHKHGYTPTQIAVLLDLT